MRKSIEVQLSAEQIFKKIDRASEGSPASRIIERIRESRFLNTNWQYYRDLRKNPRTKYGK